MISRHSVAMVRRGPKRMTADVSRSIKVHESGSTQSAADVKTAEKLVVAARENVRFLNRHLRTYRGSLELPPYVDNALYLAYTIRVKETAPFEADDIRHYLHESGIETTASFSFDTAHNRSSSRHTCGNTDERAFCIACHHYLTIPDLEHIVDAFESFFENPENERGQIDVA